MIDFNPPAARHIDLSHKKHLQTISKNSEETHRCEEESEFQGLSVTMLMKQGRKRIMLVYENSNAGEKSTLTKTFELSGYAYFYLYVFT